MTYLFYSIRASPAQMRCEPSCTAYLFPHFCHRFAPPKTTSLPKKFFSFAVKRCIMLLECAAFCFLWEIFVICQQSLPLQFIPARGRKLSRCFDGAVALVLQFIPARGRKLFGCRVVSVEHSLQFIPARGRKHFRIYADRFTLELQFIPARGRKLIQGDFDVPAVHCNLSP